MSEIGKRYKKLLERNLKKYYWDELGLKDWQKRINQRLRRKNERSTMRKIKRLGFSLKNKKVLEVGFGWGGICLGVAKEGGEVFGIEPDEEKVEIAKLLFKEEDKKADLRLGVAENLPFPDESFDFIICNMVLEHVENVSQSIAEMIRVLRAGGTLYLACPNYIFPFEGHYKIIYPSLFPRFLVKIYLRLRGRNPNFIDTINYVNPFRVKKELRKYPVEIKDLGVNTLGKYRPFKGKGRIRKFLCWFLPKLGFYPSILMVVTKKRRK